MKEKIWIEKLIELLNEYNEWWHWRDENFDANKLLVISKKYWFIKWLIENDKIDIEKIRDLDIADNFNYEYFNKNKSDFLISLLSISDTPIEDLISYLK